MYIAQLVDVRSLPKRCASRAPVPWKNGEQWYQKARKKKSQKNLKKMENNQVKIRKIHLQTFMDVLADLFDKGVDYIDIIGVINDDQDSIAISFCKDYMAEEYAKNFDNMPEFDGSKFDINLSDENDLNQLI